MRKITCEIYGIKTLLVSDNKRVFMAKFPLDEERCKQWVKATGKVDLVYVPIEKSHQLKYLCVKHFQSKDFKKKKTQLKKTAILCLEISSTLLSDDTLVGFPLHCIDSSQPLPARRTDNVQLIANYRQLYRRNITTTTGFCVNQNLQHQPHKQTSYWKRIVLLQAAVLARCVEEHDRRADR